MRRKVLVGILLVCLIVGAIPISTAQTQIIERWDFNKDFEGWDRTGSVPHWHTMESGIIWHDYWAGVQGVIVMDACESTPDGYEDVHASGGIKKVIELPTNEEKIILTANAVKHENDGGIRFMIIDSDGQHTLGEQILSGRGEKQFSYDISEWKGKTVTLEIKAFGAGTQMSGCWGSSHGCGTCCGEYVGIDWIKVEVVDEQSAPHVIREFPSSSTESLAHGGTQTFMIRAIDVDGDLHMAQWEVNGEWIETDSLATLNEPNLEGSADFTYTFEEHSTVKAIVYDERMNSDSITWDVEVITTTTPTTTSYIRILEDEIVDGNNNLEDGVQGIVKIPVEYSLPPDFSFYYYELQVGGHHGRIYGATMAGFTPAQVKLPVVEGGDGKLYLEITSHLFENEGTIICLALVGYTGGGIGGGGDDDINLDFQNEVEVMNWEDKFSEWGIGDIIFGGEWDKLGHADITKDELSEYFSEPYEHVTEINNLLSQQGYYDVKFLPGEEAGEFEFVGDVEKKKEEWLPKVDVGLTIVGLVLSPPIGWIGVAYTLAGMAGQQIIFIGGEEIYKVTQPERGLQYKWIPSGDLEGNVYLLFVRTSAKQKYVNGVVRYRLVYPFYLSQSGTWDIPTQEIVEGYPEIYSMPAITTIMNKGTEWDPDANCIESIEITEEGETKTIKLKIMDNVVPNWYSGYMHLGLEFSQGVKISNAKANDEETKILYVKEVGSTYNTKGDYLIRSYESIEGKGRVILNIPKESYSTSKEVSFDITLTKENQEPIEILCGIIPVRVYEQPKAKIGSIDWNPITIPDVDYNSHFDQRRFYYPYDLKHSFEITPSIPTPTPVQPVIDFDAIFAAISDFFEVIISALNEIVTSLKEKTIGVPPEQKAKQNVEEYLDALSSMAGAYSEFMKVIYETSEVEPPEGSEVKFNYHVLSSKFCKNVDEARTYMSSEGIKSTDISDALKLVTELEVEKNGFCIVIVDYSFTSFGEGESGKYPIVCNEKGDPSWESWQFYENIKKEIEESYKEHK